MWYPMDTIEDKKILWESIFIKYLELVKRINLMIKKEANEQICSKNKNAIIISANGFISRDLFEVQDKPSNFYMIGSMGLASSIG